MFSLRGKVIVVSGASSGIGAEIVRHLSEVGAKPIGVDLQSTPEAPDSYVCDVSDQKAVAETFARIEAEHGPFDGAVACAGLRNFGTTTSILAEAWRRVIDVNLNGVFYFCAEAARQCTRHGSGAIVTISSVAAFGGLPERANYCAAKAGVVSLTKTMAVELAQQNIRVNSVAPGSVETPLAIQNTAHDRARMYGRTPLGRAALPREVSNVVLFLLSDLSSYITGETILVDGGWSANLL